VEPHKKTNFHPVYAYYSKSAGEFATLYRHHHLRGGHVIKLGPGNDDAAKEALKAWPGETAWRYGKPQGLIFCPKMLSISAAGLQRTTVDSGSKWEPRRYLASTTLSVVLMVPGYCHILSLSCRKLCSGTSSKHLIDGREGTTRSGREVFLC
jgi:hypothetical protein